MRKLWVSLLLVLMLSGSVRAQDGLTDLLAYFPVDTDVALSFRIDDAYIDALDAIWGRLVDKVPARLSLPRPGLRQLLDQVPILPDLSLHDLLTWPWFRDHAAIGVIDATASDPLGIIIAEITNRNEAEQLVEDLLREANEPFSRRLDRVYSIYLIDGGTPEVVVAISDEVIILASTADFAAMQAVERSLLDSVAVQTALRGLPATDYNLIGYADALAVNAGQDMPDMDPTVVFGLTILDETVLAMDLAQLNSGAALPAIDRAFMRYVPVNAAAVLHSVDLSATFELLAQPSSLAARDIRSLQDALSLLGIDLQADILSWTTGDFILFSGFDIPALLRVFDTPGIPWSALPLDIGLVIEATDASKARDLVDELERLLELLAANQRGVDLTRRTVGGGDALVLTIAVPFGFGEPLPVEVVIGANEDIFFVATEPATRMMFNSLLGLDGTNAFQRAGAYFLPDSASLAYVDGDGVVVSVVAALTLLGPQIGDIFSDLIDQLQRGPQIQAQQVDYHAQQPDDLLLLLGALRTMFDNATITSAYADKLLLTRLTLEVADE